MFSKVFLLRIYDYVSRDIRSLSGPLKLILSTETLNVIVDDALINKNYI